jgi:DNA polymerase III alpha subunit
LLDETFGVILYQEQVLRIANELADFSLAEANLLRRAMSPQGISADIHFFIKWICDCRNNRWSERCTGW